MAYWAQKLECPVDDNANYENTYVCMAALGGEHHANRPGVVVQSGPDPYSQGQETVDMARLRGVLDHHR